MWSIREARCPHACPQPRQNPPSLSGPLRVGRHQAGRGLRGPACVQVVGERLDTLVPQRAGLLGEFACAAGVVQPDIGDRAALLLGGLRSDARPRVLFAEAPVLDEALDPHLGVGMDDHHQREHRRHLRFDEQRDVLDDHGFVVCGLDQL